MRGLYAITDAGLQPADELAERVVQAIEGGAALIQYRDKSDRRLLRRAQAGELAIICEQRGVPLIINDDVGLAAEVGAAGVHLGRDDGDPAAARRLLGEGALIGVSCYADWQRAVDAARAGTDYIAFGRFFPSRTKPHTEQAELDLLRRAKRELGLHVVAIGGITPDNGATLLEAGADMLAVVHGVFGAADVATAARQYAALFR